MHFQILLLVVLGLTHLGTPLFVHQGTPLTYAPSTVCDCSGANDTGIAGKDYVCRDPRLGPKILPRKFPLLSFVSDYDRFGSLTPGAFLEKWTKGGYFVYPPQEGFQLNDAGEPICGNMTLMPGQKVDRFGSEYGSFVSAADAPYSQRALPPSNLDTPTASPDYPYNYHIYTVIKPLDVLGGPIAPWFGQPGLGAQFYVGATGNILSLISQGYLERVNKTELVVGPGRGGRCGL